MKVHRQIAGLLATLSVATAIAAGLTHALALSPDGKTLALAGSGSRKIELREPATGRLAGEIDSRRDYVWSIAFATPDRLFSSGAGPNVTGWDVPRRRVEREVPGRFEGPNWIAASPDGKRIAQRFPGGVVTIHDLDAPEQARELSDVANALMPSVAFSPDGRRIAYASDLDPDKSAATCILIDDFETQQAKRLGEEAFVLISALAWSPDGRLIAVASENPGEPDTARVVTILSAATGTRLQVMSGHADMIRDLAFTPDGTKLLSASQDTTLLLWDLAAALEKLRTGRAEQ
ncbi:MAG: hypothetical protein WD066_19755 [Planctomycetaceae bacterium]